VFYIRRSLFIVAANDPEAFLKDNTYYRFFEMILNATISYAEDLSFFRIIFDQVLRHGYARQLDDSYFNYEKMKENYLKKVTSDDIRKEVSKLMDNYLFHFGLFLYTRTIWETILFSTGVLVAMLCIGIQSLLSKNIVNPLKKVYEESSQQTVKMMNNSQFASAASRVSG
jgi:hypothetical protein